MKRMGVLDKLYMECPSELYSLYNNFIEEITDFFYKYSIFVNDNIYYKVFECIKSDTYMTYTKISEYASINDKGVIKIVNRIEKFMIKILKLDKYKRLNALINTI